MEAFLKNEGSEAMLTTKRLWITRDKVMRDRWINFLKVNDLQHDDQVDYTIGIFDKDELIGTASTYRNIIKLVAVCGDYQAQNLLTQLITELSNYLWSNSYTKVFIYTKPESVKYFSSLGFQTIAQTNSVAFMERGTPNFEQYANKLREVQVDSQKAGAIVMNANPFTKGHLHLVKTALKQCDHLYIFVLSDDTSMFSFEDRFRLVKEGTAHLSNLTVVPSGEYQVSQATFPSYFLKEQAEENIAKHQAELDANLFKNRIAPILDIKIRFMGAEPQSKVTDIYNEAMQKVFGEEMELVIVPRLQSENEVISATQVRKAFEKGNFSLIERYTPPSTYQFLLETYNKKKQ